MLSETIIALFGMVIGFAAMYLSFERQREYATVMWAPIACILFLVTMLYSMTIPFSTDASGAVVGTSANMVLAGFNLLFFCISLVYSIYIALHAFKR